MVNWWAIPAKMPVPDEKALSAELQAAMKAGAKTRVSVLRLLLTAVKNARVAKMDELGEDEILGVIQREVRRREEAASEFRKGGREDRASAEETEAEILRAWLPEQLSQEELHSIIEEVVAELGASSPGDMGKVMREVMERTKGRAEGRVVSGIVKSRLGG